MKTTRTKLSQRTLITHFDKIGDSKAKKSIFLGMSTVNTPCICLQKSTGCIGCLILRNAIKSITCAWQVCRVPLNPLAAHTTGSLAPISLVRCSYLWLTPKLCQGYLMIQQYPFICRQREKLEQTSSKKTTFWPRQGLEPVSFISKIKSDVLTT